MEISHAIKKLSSREHDMIRIETTQIEGEKAGSKKRFVVINRYLAHNANDLSTERVRAHRSRKKDELTSGGPTPLRELKSDVKTEPIAGLAPGYLGVSSGLAPGYLGVSSGLAFDDKAKNKPFFDYETVSERSRSEEIRSDQNPPKPPQGGAVPVESEKFDPEESQVIASGHSPLLPPLADTDSGAPAPFRLTPVPNTRVSPSEPSKKPRKARAKHGDGGHLSPDWKLSVALREKLRKSYGVDPLQCVIQFVDHFVNGNGRDKTHSDWESRFTSWVSQNKIAGRLRSDFEASPIELEHLEGWTPPPPIAPISRLRIVDPPKLSPEEQADLDDAVDHALAVLGPKKAKVNP